MRISLALALAAAPLLAAPGSAAVSVFGNSKAVSCYEAAEGRSSYVSGLQECRSALDEAALSRAQRAATHVNYGIVLMHLGRSDDAMLAYGKAIEIDEALGEAWVNRGIARWHADRQSEAALADLDRGMQLGTTEPEVAHYVRGIVNEDLGNIEAAYADYMRASELAPSWEKPRLELARFAVSETPGS